MKVAIMQPYLFPYIGYFQLIKAVDKFIIYDDVNFIQRGWINRNRILLNGQPHMFTIPCAKSSQNKLINEIAINLEPRSQKKLFKTFEHSYKKSPMYKEVIELLFEAFSYEGKNLSDFLTNSIKLVCHYLKIKTELLKSSEKYNMNKGNDKADRLINITKSEGSIDYINSIGGLQVYDKEYFLNKGVRLSFLQPNLKEYKQFENVFVPGLSIIDALMFNDRERVVEMLNYYNII